MLPDVSGIDRVFDYRLPPELDAVAVGSIVRVPLHGRNVRGWVVEEPPEPPPDLELHPVRALLAAGPAPEIVDLARFGAWRYAGRLRPFLVAASPRRLVDANRQGAAAPRRFSSPPPGADEVASAVRSALAAGAATLRLPPAAERLPVVTEVLAALEGAGDLLVLVPERRDVELLVARLARLGVPAARHPEDWAAAAAGGAVVVGTRTAALAPVGSLAAVVVLDAQAEAYVDERAPTYSAVVIARERARRAGAPFLAVSPCPPLELVAAAPPVTLPAAIERSRWPAIEILDRRGEDPRTGRYGERLAPAIRQACAEQPGRPVLCVLNRTGAARRLACASCFELARCESCGAALAEDPAEPGGPRRLACPRCGARRPFVCADCGGAKMRVLRVGATRAGEELAALTGLDVVTVAGADRRSALAAAPVYVGTEALLHRVGRASLVVFLDLDLDLLAPRLRAGERSLELIARAGRLVGGRPKGRVLVQTRCPDHEVLAAARSGDPGAFSAGELARRAALEMPPFRAVALLSGADAPLLAARLVAEEGLEAAPRLGVDGEGSLLVRAADDEALAVALDRQRATALDVRVAVDPVAW